MTYRSDSAGGCAFDGVDEDEKLHQVICWRGIRKYGEMEEQIPKCEERSDTAGRWGRILYLGTHSSVFR